MSNEVVLTYLSHDFFKNLYDWKIHVQFVTQSERIKLFPREHALVIMYYIKQPSSSLSSAVSPLKLASLQQDQPQACLAIIIVTIKIGIDTFNTVHLRRRFPD